MAYNYFYFQPLDSALTATQLKQKTGITYFEGMPNENLNRSKVYPVNEIADPYDAGLYTTVLSYTINGTEADQTWTPTAKPLADAKINGSEAQKEKYEAEAVAIQDDYGNLTLIAAAAKTSAQRSSSETSIIDSLKAIATNLSNDLASIEAATDVDESNAIVNP